MLKRMVKKTLKNIVAKESHRKHNSQEEPQKNEVYVPTWAQTLIDLYTSPLKDEVLREMQENK